MSEKRDIPLFNGKLFDWIVTILIALSTIQVALTAYLEADARARADRAVREAQDFAIQAMGTRAAGQIETGYARSDAYLTDWDLSTMSFVAWDKGDIAAGERYDTIRAALREVSPPLTSEHFDREIGYLDNAAYEADAYVRDAAALSERFVRASELEDGWSNKANAYVANLTLLAVTLFFYGLSLTMGRPTRWLMTGMGVALAGVVLLWMVVTLLRPVRSLPDAAIDAYADGAASRHRFDDQEAVALFTEAIELAPDYTRAYDARGDAYFELGQLNRAASDYETVLSAGPSEVRRRAAWNLGWLRYLQGDAADAIRFTDIALQDDPEQIGLIFNRGLMHLISGQTEMAEEIYAEGMTLSTDQVREATELGQQPSASFWWYMEAAAIDLDNLLLCIDGVSCDDSAPREAIADPGTVAPLAEDLRTHLKSLALALEQTGEPPAETQEASLGPITFLAADPRTVDGEAGQQDFELGTLTIWLQYDYEGIQDGQTVITRVYSNGREDMSLRSVEQWASGPSGTRVQALASRDYVGFFLDGTYRVEIYVDYWLVQEGSFVIR